MAKLSLEEKLVLWEDRRAVKNLMGRVSMALLLKQEADIVESFWSKRDDVCFGVNSGWYVGREAIASYYNAAVEGMKKSDDILRKRFSFMKEFGDQEHGFGYLEAKTISEGIIEIAGDRETSKGLWPCAGQITDFSDIGPISYWTFGWYAADFVREEDEWKLWHLSYLEDIKHPMGEKWWEPPKEREAFPEFAPMREVQKPSPNVPIKRRDYYNTERPFVLSQPMPIPYEHFGETFSYGFD